MIRFVFLVMIMMLSANAKEYPFRKYQHVKFFYSQVTQQAIEISKKYHLPPAALLAMAGLESGYGSGYVSQITGNILSLGAYKSDKELPRLYLPYSKIKKRILYDAKEIEKHNKSDLSWKLRAPSLKRDYRPSAFAGSTKKLNILKYDTKLKKEAYKKCFKDFATRWISKNSSFKIYRKTREWLDKLVAKKGLSILFEKKTNMDFIDKIGGHPNSFNYRSSWPKKVKLIMNKVGLIKLTYDMNYKHLSFKQAWLSQNIVKSNNN